MRLADLKNELAQRTQIRSTITMGGQVLASSPDLAIEVARRVADLCDTCPDCTEGAIPVVRMPGESCRRCGGTGAVANTLRTARLANVLNEAGISVVQLMALVRYLFGEGT